MKFYVGFDSSHPESSEACARSIARFTSWNSVEMIHTPALRASGLYWRNHNGTESTDFTYTRFLTPYIHGNNGPAVFCDGDFLWRKNPESLMEYYDPAIAVKVVKHNITPDMLTSTKMDGKIQTWYPRKNWSSLMLFNTGHSDCKSLHPIAVSSAAPAYLHGFQWTDVDASPELPRKFNHLVGYYSDSDPVAVHFTDGGPWLEEYSHVEYAREWHNV